MYIGVKGGWKRGRVTNLVNLQVQYAPKMVPRHSVHLLISPCYLNTLFSGSLTRNWRPGCFLPVASVQKFGSQQHMHYMWSNPQILKYPQPSTAKPWTSNNETLHQKWQKSSKIPNTWPVIPKSYLVLPSFHLQISDLHIIHDLQSLFVHSSFCHSTDNAAKADAVGLLLFALLFGSFGVQVKMGQALPVLGGSWQLVSS